MAALRVALVTHYFPAHRGGVEAVAGELAARLQASGAADIDWHASDTDPAPPGIRSFPARAWNVTERRLGFPYPLWSPGALAKLARAVRSADAVHLHDCLYPANVFAFVVAKLARRPVIVTQHIGAVPYRNPLLRLLLAAANRVLGALVLGHATQTVFVSDAVRGYFARFVRFRAEPLHVPNGVDTGRFSPGARGAHRGPPNLLFVGRFVEKKGLPMLREIAAAIPEARWVFAGWGPFDPRAWALPNVQVEISPPRERLVELYRAADLLVLPSVGEGFPLVVQEAMACGTPALITEETATGAPAARHVLYTAPLEAGRWVASIRELLPALEARRASVALFAREHWSWDECAARYAELLRAVVKP